MPRCAYLSRLNLLLGVFSAAAVALSLLGFSAVTRLVATQKDLSRLADFRWATQRVQYDFANVNSWQTAYAFDRIRHGPSAVPRATSRRSFLDALARYRQDLAKLRDHSIGRPERDQAVLASVSRSLEEFARIDDQIIQLYRTGDAASRDRANNLVMGQEIAIVNSTVDALGDLAESVAQEEADKAASASASTMSAMSLVVLLGVLVLVAGPVGSWFIARSIHQHVLLTESEARLAHQALHDSLTGLANRSLLHDHLTHALARAERARTEVGVIFLDMDDFKTINDSLGHAAGDELLVQVAQRLTGVLRGSDLAARLGGDEFVVACEGLTDPQEISLVAERVLTELEQEVQLGGRSVSVSASMGIAVSQPGSRVDELLRDADSAMYRAKNTGKRHWELSDRRTEMSDRRRS